MLVSVSQDFKIKAISLKEQPCLKCIIISINIDAIGKKDPSVKSPLFCLQINLKLS